MRLMLACGLATLFLGSLTTKARATDVFLANQIFDSIDKISPAGAVTHYIYTDPFSDPPYYPYGMALDAAGNIYVALTTSYGTYGYGAIKEYSPSGTLISKILTNTVLAPTLVTVEGNSNLYMIAFNFQRNEFYEFDKVSPAGVVTTLHQFSTFDNPTAMVADAAGNIYIADGSVLKFDVVHQTMSTFVALPFSVTGIAFDAQGNLFATQNKGNSSAISTLVKIGPDGSQTLYASNLDNPQEIAMTKRGLFTLPKTTST